MKKEYLFSKLHTATVTDAEVAYDGSITIDRELLSKANINEYEKVLVVNISNGNRFETYTIAGNKGEIILNGGTALLGKKGDKLIIFAFCILDDDEAKKHKPNKIFLDAKNEILRESVD